MEDQKYPIYERFLAFQGEGAHAGRKAFFIRTFGCPVHCPWCDSAGTWHKDWKPSDGVSKMSAVELAKEARKARPQFVVLTGGEPTVHKLAALEAALRGDPVGEQARMPRLRVHLETCGGFDLHGVQMDWITLSPKREKDVRGDMFVAADEFKLILDTPEALGEWCEWLRKTRYENGFMPTGANRPVYLHPEWSQRDEPWVKRAISGAVAGGVEVEGFEFRAGYQMHKLFNCDALDDRSRPLVPLGGDEAKGY